MTSEVIVTTRRDGQGGHRPARAPRPAGTGPDGSGVPDWEVDMPFFDTRDGSRLAYEDHGSGAAIVFVAGWSLGCDMWEYQVPFFLESGYRCVLLDRRGHGRSDRPSAGYDLDTLAEDLAGFVEHRALYFATQLGNRVFPALQDETVRQCLRASPVAALALQRANLEAAHETELARFPLPALVVHGDADASAPVAITGRRTAKAIPGCVYREYPRAGHGLYASHAESLNRDILDFVRS